MEKGKWERSKCSPLVLLLLPPSPTLCLSFEPADISFEPAVGEALKQQGSKLVRGKGNAYDDSLRINVEGAAEEIWAEIRPQQYMCSEEACSRLCINKT